MSETEVEDVLRKKIVQTDQQISDALQDLSDSIAQEEKNIHLAQKRISQAKYSTQKAKRKRRSHCAISYGAYLYKAAEHEIALEDLDEDDLKAAQLLDARKITAAAFLFEKAKIPLEGKSEEEFIRSLWRIWTACWIGLIIEKRISRLSSYSTLDELSSEQRMDLRKKLLGFSYRPE